MVSRYTGSPNAYIVYRQPVQGGHADDGHDEPHRDRNLRAIVTGGPVLVDHHRSILDEPFERPIAGLDEQRVARRPVAVAVGPFVCGRRYRRA